MHKYCEDIRDLGAVDTSQLDITPQTDKTDETPRINERPQQSCKMPERFKDFVVDCK